MCLIWSLCFRIRCHAIHSRHQHGLGSSFQREYFLCAGLRFVSFQQFGFSSLPPLSLCRLWRQRSNRWQFAFPLFLILRFAWGLPHVLIPSFMPLIQTRRFTTRHLLCWLRHQRAFRAVSAFCSLVSLSNSVFGATDPVFGKGHITNRLFKSYRCLVFMLGSKTPRFRSIRSAMLFELKISLTPTTF